MPRRCEDKDLPTKRYVRKRCQRKEIDAKRNTCQQEDIFRERDVKRDISEKEISRKNIGHEEQLKPKCLLQGGSEERGLQ